MQASEEELNKAKEAYQLETNQIKSSLIQVEEEKELNQANEVSQKGINHTLKLQLLESPTLLKSSVSF